MNKKISLGAAIAFMAIVAAATLTITMMIARRSYNDKMSDLQNREERYNKIALIDGLVRDYYFGTVNQEDMINAVASGMVGGLGDPYAVYYSAAQYTYLQNEAEGRSVQIGIVAVMDESGYIKIAEVYPESPAQAASIEAGDLIIKIDDLDVTADNYFDATNMLVGEPGTKMTITVRRGVDENVLEMTRRAVEKPSLSSTMLANSIGLVTIREFGANATEQFIKQVDGLVDQGAQGLIFDVRNVGEGKLQSVAGVLDKLLPKGTIVSSADKNGTLTELANSDGREVPLPMVVLVNEKTTSEAELFAAALRDYEKARLVGMKTAGKGSIQRILPLSDGSGAIRLTTGMYIPPAGVGFDKEGLKPDFEVKLTEEQIALMTAGDPDSDLQMKKAMEVLIAQMKTEGFVPLEPVVSAPGSSESTQSVPASSAASSDAQGNEDGEDESQADESESNAEESASADESSSAASGT